MPERLPDRSGSTPRVVTGDAARKWFDDLGVCICGRANQTYCDYGKRKDAGAVPPCTRAALDDNQAQRRATMGESHSRNGFYFKRQDDGSVRVRIAIGNPEGGQWDDTTLREITVPPNEWASVIASVCARGADSASYQDAQDFHMIRSDQIPPADAGAIRGLVPEEDDRG